MKTLAPQSTPRPPRRARYLCALWALWSIGLVFTLAAAAPDGGRQATGDIVDGAQAQVVLLGEAGDRGAGVAERRAIGDNEHILLEEVGVNVLQGQLLPAVAKAAAGDAGAHPAAELKDAAHPEEHRAIHHHLELTAHHAHVDGRADDHAVAAANGLVDGGHVVVDRAGVRGPAGPAARAGIPVPVPDAQITPDMQEFATIDVMSRASAEGGSGIDLGGFASNIDFNQSSKVDVKVKEKEPEPDEFIPVEKEPGVDYSRLQSLVIYPDLAKRAGIEGRVTIRVLIDKDGSVRKMFIEDSDNSLLNEAAENAIRNYGRFKPAIQNQEPIMCWISIPIQFKLR